MKFPFWFLLLSRQFETPSRWNQSHWFGHSRGVFSLILPYRFCSKDAVHPESSLSPTTASYQTRTQLPPIGTFTGNDRSSEQNDSWGLYESYSSIDSRVRAELDKKASGTTIHKPRSYSSSQPTSQDRALASARNALHVKRDQGEKAHKTPRQPQDVLFSVGSIFYFPPLSSSFTYLTTPHFQTATLNHVRYLLPLSSNLEF